MRKQDLVNFNKNNVTIGNSQKGYGLTYFAKRDFSPEETVLMGFGRLIKHQTRHISVQLGFRKHFYPLKWAFRYLNHSCDPNCFIRTRNDGFPNLIALRPIIVGEEITMAYWMTEYVWAKNAFEIKNSCKCGSRVCDGKILSFSQLSKDRKIKHNGHISEYLLSEIKI